MPQLKVKQSANLELTLYSGLALLGKCFETAQVDVMVDHASPVSQGVRSSDLVKSASRLD